MAHVHINRSVTKKITLKDLLILFILPALVLIIIQYLVPYPVKKEYFILNAAHPSFSALFLTNYVHTDDPAHLWVNVFFYELTLFCILKYSTNKNEVYIASAIFFFALPFVISLTSLNILYGMNIYLLGFSGIVAGFMGYFVYVIYRYVKKHYIHKLNYTFVLLILSINVSFGVIFYYRELILWIPILFISILICVWLYWKYFKIYFRRMMNIIKEPRKALEKISFISLLCYTITFFLLFMAFVYMIKPPGPNDSTNSYAHFVGYMFGVFVPLIFFEAYSYLKGGARDA